MINRIMRMINTDPPIVNQSQYFLTKVIAFRNHNFWIANFISRGSRALSNLGQSNHHLLLQFQLSIMQLLFSKQPLSHLITEREVKSIPYSVRTSVPLSTVLHFLLLPLMLSVLSVMVFNAGQSISHSQFSFLLSIFASENHSKLFAPSWIIFSDSIPTIDRLAFVKQFDPSSNVSSWGKRDNDSFANNVKLLLPIWIVFSRSQSSICNSVF